MTKYIYDRPEWPVLTFDVRTAHEPLMRVHRAQGRLYGKLDSLGFEVRNDLQLSSVSDEVVTSSEIEGEVLNRSSVRSSVAKRLGLEIAGLADTIPDRYADGVVDIAIDATQNYTLPVTDERLFSWHAALFPSGRSGIRRITVGEYRTDEVSVVSGVIGKEKVHYRAPHPECVPGEMKKLLEWIEADNKTDPYVKSAIAHLWFEAIHPFDDGNGRVGRSISELLLARAEKSPLRYYSMSSQILKERKAYYEELELATDYAGDIGRWVVWFIGCLVRAMEASEDKLETAVRKASVFGQIRKPALNDRQNAMINRLIDGLEGKLTTAKWAKISKCSHDTALRDIESLIEQGILVRSAEGGRSTSYVLNL